MPGKRLKAIPRFDIPDVNLGNMSVASSKQARAIRTKGAIHFARLNRKLECAVSARGRHLDTPSLRNMAAMRTCPFFSGAICHERALPGFIGCLARLAPGFCAPIVLGPS